MLEEVSEAEVLLHVVDASSAQAPDQTAHVMATLKEIGSAQRQQAETMEEIVAGQKEITTIIKARGDHN